MIKIPRCFFCKHLFDDQIETQETSQLRMKEIRCEAYPNGIPKLKQTEEADECINGFYFEKK